MPSSNNRTSLDDAKRSRLSPGELLGLGFVAQAIWSLISWLVVNDSAEFISSWYNDDFEEWLVASGVGVVALAVYGGLVAGRWLGALVTGAGSLLAVGVWLVLFVYSAVMGSN